MDLNIKRIFFWGGEFRVMVFKYKTRFMNQRIENVNFYFAFLTVLVFL